MVVKNLLVKLTTAIAKEVDQPFRVLWVMQSLSVKVLRIKRYEQPGAFQVELIRVLKSVLLII